MCSWAPVNYSYITVRFSDPVLCIFFFSKPKNPPATFVSCGVVAVTFNVIIQKLYYIICRCFLIRISKDGLIVVSHFTENYYNKTKHVLIIYSLIIFQDSPVSGSSVASEIALPTVTVILLSIVEK